MDKNTLSEYMRIIIVAILMGVLLNFIIPFGRYVGNEYMKKFNSDIDTHSAGVEVIEQEDYNNKPLFVPKTTVTESEGE